MAQYFSAWMRKGSVPLFLALELVCILLIVSFNENQQAIASYTLGNFQGKINKLSTSIGNQWTLQERLDSISWEQARLLEFCLSANGETHGADSLRRDSFSVIPARVINNSINRRNNYITIDKGRLDGIEQDMGVISARGPVGVVRAVSDHYALVMSLLHQQSRISARLKNSGYFGSLRRGYSRNPKKMYLADIPRHAPLSVGDTVLTSGYSDLFPEGMTIGTVDTFWVPSASDFYEIELTLFPDIARLHHVYVLDKKHTEEKELLEQEWQHE